MVRPAEMTGDKLVAPDGAMDAFASANGLPIEEAVDSDKK